MDVDVEVIEIEKIKYLIIDEIKDSNNTYLYLINSKDPEDIMIRKIKDNDKDYVVEIESDEEFDKALDLFEDKFNKTSN